MSRSDTTLSAELADVIVAVGVDDLASAVFHHDLPTPAELELAIDVVEDAIMAAHLGHAERGELETSDPLLRSMPGLQSDGARPTLGEVEALFQRLAFASLGNPGAHRGVSGDLPAGRRAAAALLILRECLHHLGFDAMRAKGSSRRL